MLEDECTQASPVSSIKEATTPTKASQKDSEIESVFSSWSGIEEDNNDKNKSIDEDLNNNSQNNNTDDDETSSGSSSELCST